MIILPNALGRLLPVAFLGLLLPLQAQNSLPDLSSVPEDLAIPAVSIGEPAAGKLVRQQAAGWKGTDVHHLLYLPADWKPESSWPVIVEYPGNGGYNNKYGDRSDGLVEDCRLGYGLTAGKGCVWLCLPYVEKDGDGFRNAVKWWGDIESSKRYCQEAVKEVCTRLGGDSERVILAGFSRGSIGCNYLGLHDDSIASLWCGFICHSHYDGVREQWPYPGADRASALERLGRLQGRPQFISHEGSAEQTRSWLESSGVRGNWTFAPLPFRNHSNAWVLRDIPLRRQARAWLESVLKKK